MDLGDVASKCITGGCETFETPTNHIYPEIMPWLLLALGILTIIAVWLLKKEGRI